MNIRVFASVLILSLIFDLSLFCDASIQTELNQLFQKASSHRAWSVLVEAFDNPKKQLFSLTPKRRLMAASNVKVPVCAATLLKLGPDFTYQTELYLTGEPLNGVVHGDLLIVGAGDPSIGGRYHDGDLTYDFRQWAALLKEKNIHTIQGQIIGIDNAFDDIAHGLNWSPDQYIEWYEAEVSALSFNDACVDVLIQAGSQSGKPALVSLNPPTKYFSINPFVRTVSSKKKHRGIAITRDDNSMNLNVKGTIRAKRASTHYASVINPTLYFATVLKETLQSEGIQILGGAYDGDDLTLPPKKTWQRFHVHHSPPLMQLIKTCLKNSQNLYAEHFLKTLGLTESGEGSWQTGVLALKEIFFEHGCDVDTQFFADGSGLSRENRLSAFAMTKILRLMTTTQYGDLFRQALPLAGVDGTLKLRMRQTPAYKRVSAKTGTINGVRALSGYVQSKSGQRYIFSMIGNATRQASQLSRVMDEACALIAEKG